MFFFSNLVVYLTTHVKFIIMGMQYYIAIIHISNTITTQKIRETHSQRGCYTAELRGDEERGMKRRELYLINSGSGSWKVNGGNVTSRFEFFWNALIRQPRFDLLLMLVKCYVFDLVVLCYSWFGVPLS